MELSSLMRAVTIFLILSNWKCCWFFSVLFPSFIYTITYVCISVCEYSTCVQVPEKAKGGHQIPCGWSYRC